VKGHHFGVAGLLRERREDRRQCAARVAADA
jgi:hypothetical protein